MVFPLLTDVRTTCRSDFMLHAPCGMCLQARRLPKVLCFLAQLDQALLQLLELPVETLLVLQQVVSFPCNL